MFYRVWPYCSQNFSRSFLSASLIRKYIFTALVIILGQQEGPDAAILLFILQFVYLVYLGLSRPFRSILDNIIEISLESVYCILLVFIMIDIKSEEHFEWEKAFPHLLLTL